jgi:peptidyl-dipeptidase Dcp
MKRFITFLWVAIIMTACSNNSNNPLLKSWNTPFEVPPFESIKEQHFLPAFKEAMQDHQKEIADLVSNEEEATFENTIAALDYSGAQLDKVENVFYNLNSANTNEEMQAIAKEVSPLSSKHYDDINLNPQLFERVKIIYNKKGELGLTTEQTMLLEETYKGFVRSGANLPEDEKLKLREINEELSMLTLKFGENVLAETNGFKLVLTDSTDLAGLPQWLIDQAAETAKENGEGNWVFTLHKPSWIPFLQYSAKRELRKKLYTAWMHIGDNDNDQDNKEVLSQIVSLRVKKANLLGYPSWADYILDDKMAAKPANVLNLLDQVWKPAVHRAKAEAYDMQKLIDAENGGFKLDTFDWWYYAEKIRQQKYALSDDVLKPYFQLKNVRAGLFDVAEKLYGLRFEQLPDLPIYHEDVVAYDVKEADGSHLSVLYMDFFPRASKRSGAWMTSYRKESKKDGEKISPVISIVMNFSKPTGDTPALLTTDEVLTLYHEFGHALHGMLSDCTYPGLSGTSVKRDFVELPSQIMENWALDVDVVKSYAKHYETGEPIPNDLVKKIEKSSQFNQGFATVEYLAASYLDMKYHTATSSELIKDVDAFETDAMNDLGLISEIIPRYRSGYFQHVFAGGYSSGYYGYMWAEVLDADAFEAFKETSLFDQNTASAFRSNILERGGTENPMDLYTRFRGREPEITPLLKRRGLL